MELWESLVLDKFPNSSKEQMAEAKYLSAIAWMFNEETPMTELYSKYVMMKRLRGDENGN
jgi:hypothetical protein